MKKYTSLLLLIFMTLCISCMDDSFTEAESFEDIVKEIANEKNAILIRDKDCVICDFDETEPEVIFCEDFDEDGNIMVVQISQGAVVELKGITLLEQLEKVSSSAICRRVFACQNKVISEGTDGNAFIDDKDLGISYGFAQVNCESIDFDELM